ncbi:hypothetical protein BJ546DRAFT_684296 [Cryomyces antarcticus]
MRAISFVGFGAFVALLITSFLSLGHGVLATSVDSVATPMTTATARPAYFRPSGGNSTVLNHDLWVSHGNLQDRDNNCECFDPENTCCMVAHNGTAPFCVGRGVTCCGKTVCEIGETCCEDGTGGSGCCTAGTYCMGPGKGCCPISQVCGNSSVTGYDATAPVCKATALASSLCCPSSLPHYTSSDGLWSGCYPSTVPTSLTFSGVRSGTLGQALTHGVDVAVVSLSTYFQNTTTLTGGYDVTFSRVNTTVLSPSTPIQTMTKSTNTTGGYYVISSYDSVKGQEVEVRVHISTTTRTTTFTPVMVQELSTPGSSSSLTPASATAFASDNATLTVTGSPTTITMTVYPGFNYSSFKAPGSAPTSTDPLGTHNLTLNGTTTSASPGLAKTTVTITSTSTPGSSTLLLATLSTNSSGSGVSFPSGESSMTVLSTVSPATHSRSTTTTTEVITASQSVSVCYNTAKNTRGPCTTATDNGVQYKGAVTTTLTSDATLTITLTVALVVWLIVAIILAVWIFRFW